MFSTLRTRFGIPGVISVIALVFAMFGGAYAASNSSGGGKATASKAKQGKPGKPGKPGPAGPQGPAGPAGPAGAKGDAGAAGKDGTNGTNGTDGAPGLAGKNVVTTAITVAGLEGHCVGSGGTKFQVEGSATKEFVCNGAQGAEGNIKATLNSGATETGAWAVAGEEEEGTKKHVVPISFAIPLAADLAGATNVHFIEATGTVETTSGSTAVNITATTGGAWRAGAKISGTGIPANTTIVSCAEECGPGATSLVLSNAATATGTGVTLTSGTNGNPATQYTTGCTGGTGKAPKADSGHLCVYLSGNIAPGKLEAFPFFSKTGSPGIGASTTGSAFKLTLSPETLFATGSWAVTG